MISDERFPLSRFISSLPGDHLKCLHNVLTYLLYVVTVAQVYKNSQHVFLT